MSTDSAKTSLAARVQAELYATVFATGAAVMVVEILGTRIIGPVFGVSLFIWTALLIVTLMSLAIGYYLGGTLVDRRPTKRLLGKVVLAAGVLLGLVPLMRAPVLSAAVALGPRFGSLASAVLLFAPTLAALGMVGPVAIRLATDTLLSTGRRVGAVYAISTAGSVVGTFLTSFVLIPAFETANILVGTAVFLAAVGGLLLALSGTRSALGAAVIPLIGLMASIPALPDGLRIVWRSHSPYGLIEVVDDSKRDARLLRADHSIVGAYAKSDRSAAFSFLHVMESVRFMRPKARELLQIGLGIGSLPMALTAHGFRSDVVEIDPEVVRAAREHFGYSAPGEIFVEDARTFIQRTSRKYDVIIHDTFTGGGTPEHLLSLEVFQQIKAALSSGGLLAMNFVAHDSGPHAEAAYAVSRTLSAVFTHVRAFRDSPPDERAGGVTNLIYFASDEGLDFSIPADASFENEVCRQTQRSFERWEILRAVPVGPIITDARNPLARLQLPSAEEHFNGMHELLPVEYWLR
jgi:spermidine synthase